MSEPSLSRAPIFQVRICSADRLHEGARLARWTQASRRARRFAATVSRSTWRSSRREQSGDGVDEYRALAAARSSSAARDRLGMRDGRSSRGMRSSASHRSKTELHPEPRRDAARLEPDELLVLLVGEVVDGEIGLEPRRHLPHRAHVDARVRRQIHIARGDRRIERLAHVGGRRRELQRHARRPVRADARAPLGPVAQLAAACEAMRLFAFVTRRRASTARRRPDARRARRPANPRDCDSPAWAAGPNRNRWHCGIRRRTRWRSSAPRRRAAVCDSSISCDSPRSGTRSGLPTSGCPSAYRLGSLKALPQAPATVKPRVGEFIGHAHARAGHRAIAVGLVDAHAGLGRQAEARTRGALRRTAPRRCA